MRTVRGNRIAMVFQEPMTSLNPVLTIGEQIAESLRYHRGLARRGAEAEVLRLLERVRIPAAHQRLARISAPLLRRHAPARDDRDGARLPAAAADRRRADDRARRDGAGADPGADPVAAGRDGHVGHLHHARHGRRGRDRRPHAGDARGPQGRGGRDRHAVRGPGTPTRGRCSPPCRARRDARRAAPQRLPVDDRPAGAPQLRRRRRPPTASGRCWSAATCARASTCAAASSARALAACTRWRTCRSRCIAARRWRWSANPAAASPPPAARSCAWSSRTRAACAFDGTDVLALDRNALRRACGGTCRSSFRIRTPAWIRA